MTTYCSLCDTEAINVLERDGNPLYLCAICTAAFELGQCYPNEYVNDLDYLRAIEEE